MIKNEKDSPIVYDLGYKIPTSVLIESKQYYYYVCRVDNINEVSDTGITADNEGFINLFRVQKLAPYIARKLYTDITDYALFRIKKDGVMGEFDFYDKDHPLMYYNFRIKQAFIKPENIIFIGCYKYKESSKRRIYKTRDYSMFNIPDKNKKKPDKIIH